MRSSKKAVASAAAQWLAKVRRALGQNRLVHVAAILAILVPLALAGQYGYRSAKREMTEAVLAKRENISYLAATILTEKFDRLIDIGVSLATRVLFRRLIDAGKWNDAIKVLENIPKDLPFVERLFLADGRGVLMADTPALPGVRGKDFSYRDWYRKVIGAGQPYITDIYTRSAAPRINVVAVSVPIMDRQRLLGLLVMQVRLEVFFDWFKDVSDNPTLRIYIVDRNGRTAFHPNYTLDGEPVDLSRVRAVQRALAGQIGVDVARDLDDNERRITAYAPVEKYGWAAILDEPVRTAFAARDAQLRRFGIVFGLLLALSGGAAFLALRMIAAARTKTELELQVAKRTAELEHANRELESFSYSVSHDLRAPLRAIDGFSQALQEDYAGKLDRQGRDHLMRVRAATGRMALLIDNLLKLGGITRAPLNREPLDLSALAEDIVRELRESQPERSVEVRIEPNLAAHGDPQLLRVALANLLDNAWKFTGKRQDASIELGRSIDESEGPVYVVRDNGAGFDMAYVDKLFGVFQRLHGQDEFPGTGIGLATVSRVVQRHGGRIWAESKVGEGSAFYFTL